MATYALNGLRPFVADVAQQVGDQFGITEIHGYRADATDMTGHPAGLAVDFVVGAGGVTKGNQVAAYFLANHAQLKVKYVLWQQRSWWPGKGWRQMEHRSGDRAGYDPNHMRHVHVSFTADAGQGDGAGTIPGAGASVLERATADADKYGAEADSSSWLISAGDAFDNLNPFSALVDGDTWRRVAYVVGGAGLIVMGVVILVTSSKEVTGALVTAIPNPAAKVAGAAIATSGE